MPSRYHPIEDGLWDDPKFDADVLQGLPEADGDERGFYAFLCSNKMQRPCGIYRATDAEIACAYRWPVERVRATLPILCLRRLVVRDGSWIFLPGYWKRQAHNPGMTKAARNGVDSCSSRIILNAFLHHYPLHKEWLPNGWGTVVEPSSEIAPTEQYHNHNQSSTTTKTTPPSTQGEFDQFWAAYPNKKAKKLAYEKFKKARVKVPLVVMLCALEAQRKWQEWTKDGGAYIPHPATWLNQERWHDEEAHPLAAKIAPKMQGTMQALKEFVDGGNGSHAVCRDAGGPGERVQPAIGPPHD